MPGNSWRTLDIGVGSFGRRGAVVLIIVVILVLALLLRLVWVQLIKGPELSAMASEQRTAVITEPAHRGDIVDRNGQRLAYTMEARSLSVNPHLLESFMQDRHDLDPEGVSEPEERIKEIADGLPGLLEESDAQSGESESDEASTASEVKSDEILDKLNSDSTYEVLVRDVDPDVAEKVSAEYPEITVERQDIRQYPNGAVGQNVVGKISRDNEGQFGLELAQDSRLQGTNGSRTVDVGANGLAIPGSTRDRHPAVDGDAYELTLDLEAQTYIQQLVQQAKDKSGADSASAVVLDSASGEVVSMATSDTINPQGNIDEQLEDGKVFGNRVVQDAYEPGSVAKVITAAAAIEDGKTTPDEVLQVPGSIDMSGVTVKDAWDHGVVPYTTTGIFGKSSNVGTLMLADRVGEESFWDYVQKFGIGQATDLGLPSETSGYVPDLSQWSGGTFANLPIGQGMSMSLLQMASIYQTMANDGVRVTPSIIKSATDASGNEIPQDEPESVEVVSPETARSVVDMFRAVNQSDPSGVQQGTAPTAGIEGYQTSGKTGTAQQIDPETRAYSNSDYWITYAGIAPADDPRFVVAIMLDDPERGTDGSGGQSAAPLFRDITSWLLDHYNVPLSPEAAPRLTLEAQ
ncbi:MAG: peptidoglycan D,D-transpeptidase FtsI family protein [Corynebacterium sp.]|uniref:peptidoglycan D,D-transpeptidase FtsI family protein n=1 Tax=unclassified Corynebacterium TaxID=2624378 RepID=UPI002648DB57|nr:penicillin-binding protein 2 [Corynebacterium sp.]MDN5581580.1 penicillin-binding protein 2 [Corynebacterium sp.]MDN5718898.1 penicillin-binding protein 2 [Corynebacterium sp.]MDN6324574.1 penicillin-binding protein 2 [Corynebacterium sp.]MDN6509859.1 penicillin-binding protein 2 [Corynebacterium sp.]